MDAPGAFGSEGAVMTKLPIFATIATAYRFLLREFVTVVRLVWFPLLVVAIVQYLAAETTLDALAASQAAGTDQPIASPYDLIEWIAQIVVFAIVGVLLHRLILFGDRKPGQFITFAFGRAEAFFVALQLLVFGAYFLVGLLLAVALGGEALAVPSLAALGPIGALVVIGVALVYLFIRVAPVYPIVVAENRLDFPRSWELTQGKFWRLLVVFALGILPLGLAVAAAEGLFWGLASQNFAGRTLSPEAVVEITKGLIIYQVGIFYAVAILAAGLTAALLCYSYKALRGLQPDALLTPEYQVRP
jgi:hypothetical protein